MRTYLPVLLVVLTGCSCAPSQSPASSKSVADKSAAAVSEWGSPVNDLRCRVKTCVLAPDKDPDYSTRINIVLQVENTAKSDQKIRILAPHSGEPCFGVMASPNGTWQTIGNALMGPKSNQPVFDIRSGGILETDYSLGLTANDMKIIRQGVPLKCVIIAYGKGPYDPASLLSGEFAVSDKAGKIETAKVPRPSAGKQ